ESHLASTLYLVMGSVTYLVVLIPTLLYLLLSGVLTQQEIYAGGVVIIGSFVVILEFIRFFKKQGIIYWALSRTHDDIPAFIDTWKDHQYDITALRQAFVFSLGVQFLGMVVLAISLAAFGVENSIFLAVLAYVVTAVVLTLSPVFQGIGLVEFSMVYTLTQFGVAKNSALAITLLYRVFQLWLPLIMGGGIIVWTRLLRLKKN
ncbi:MAG TPA: lysylphosphatidylglycerol synthase transmembrane domain-containing protein, partial [Patescibacteria group bacterium]